MLLISMILFLAFTEVGNALVVLVITALAGFIISPLGIFLLMVLLKCIG